MLQGVNNAPIAPQIWVLGRILLYIFLLNKDPKVLVYGAFNFVFVFFHKIVNSSSLCVSKDHKNLKQSPTSFHVYLTNKVGDCFKFLWPFQKFWTLLNKEELTILWKKMKTKLKAA